MAALRADRYAQEAAKDAANWRNAAKYGYGYESALIATMAMGRYPGVRAQAQARSGLERYVAQQQRRKRNFANRNVMARAARIYNPTTKFNNLVYGGTGLWSAFKQTTSSTTRFAWKGMNAAYNAGLTAATYGTVDFLKGGMGAIRSALMSAVLGVSKALGMLMSPIGLATSAFIALSYSAIKLKNRRTKEWNEWQEQRVAIKNAGKSLQFANTVMSGKNPYNKAFDLSTYQDKEIFNTSSQFPNQWSVNPLIKNNSVYSKIFKGNVNDPLYSKALYDTYIKNNSKFLFGKDLSYNDILNKYNINGIVEDLGSGDIDYKETYGRRGRVFRDLALRTIPISAALSTSKFKNSYKELIDLRKQYSSLSEKDRGGKIGNDLMSKMTNIRNRFINIDGVDTSKMSINSIGSMRSSDMANSLIGNNYIYQLMNDLISNPDNPLNKYNESIIQIQNLSNNAISERAKALANIIGGFDFALKNANGELVNFNVFMQDNGKVNWEMTMANLDLLGVKVTNSIATNMNIMSGIVFKLKNDAETAAMFADQSASQIAGMLGATPTKIATKQLETYAKQWAINTGYVKSKKELDAFIARRNWNTPQSARTILNWLQDYTYNNTYGKLSSNNNSNIKSPNVYKPSIPSQDKYKNNYSSSAGAPSQVVINIDKLANFDKTTVANSADDREIAEAMERKIADAVAMLASQYMPMVGAQTLGNA